MKKTILASSMWIMVAALAFTACSKKEPADKVKSNGLPRAEASAPNGEIAFVDVDSLAAQYEYCKEGQKELESKQNAYRSQLNSKAQALQNAMAEFQNKAQNGGFTSQQQVQAEQSKLQKQQEQFQQFQTRIDNEMNSATLKYQQVLRDSINNFLNEYNKDGRYKMILSKSGDNILYADKALDITNDVVAGLNKRYKKAK